jgi:hypothetical protein
MSNINYINQSAAPSSFKEINSGIIVFTVMGYEIKDKLFNIRNIFIISDM